MTAAECFIWCFHEMAQPAVVSALGVRGIRMGVRKERKEARL